jgi:mono/diheme cytochrome c family protein
MIRSSREPAFHEAFTDGRVWTAAAAALFLLAGCGRGTPKSDSGATGGVTPDTTTATVPSPAPTPSPADTGMKADSSRTADTAKSGPSARSDSAGKPIASKPAAKKPTAPKPVAVAPKPSADTGAKKATSAGVSKTSDSGATQTADAPLRDAYHQPPRDTVPQDVYEGWKQFNLNCARCHGEDVSGTTIAPHLIMSLKPDGPINTKELFVSTVCAGRPAKGMPPWCSLGLGMDKIQQIYLYVKGRSDGKLAPGRPAVRSQS